MEVMTEDIPVMYILSPNGPKGAPEAFKKLEDAINWQLKGRKFYGIQSDGEYRACLAITDGEESKKFGFQTWVIPGGKYFKEKIADWEKHIAEIAPKFDEIIQKVNYDEDRPLIEFYRSQAELYLLVPIK